MIDYPALRAVAAIVRHGSFDKAARALHVTPSAISQRVRSLEDRLGTVLIVRGAPCTATETGERLCQHLERVGILEYEMLETLGGNGSVPGPEARVTLSIATSADSLASWFLPPISAFAADSPYLLDIAVDDQDHTAQWLQKGRVLAAVTALPTPVPGCRLFPLGALRYQATASPAFFRRYFGTGVTAESVAAAPGLTFNAKDRLQERWLERALGESPPFATHWLPSSQGFVDACLAGLGWGLNPELMVKSHLDDGGLVPLLPGTPLDIPLYWQINRSVSEQLSALTQSVIAAARKALQPC